MIPELFKRTCGIGPVPVLPAAGKTGTGNPPIVTLAVAFTIFHSKEQLVQALPPMSAVNGTIEFGVAPLHIVVVDGDVIDGTSFNVILIDAGVPEQPFELVSVTDTLGCGKVNDPQLTVIVPRPGALVAPTTVPPITVQV